MEIDWNKIFESYPKNILEWLEIFCEELNAERPIYPKEKDEILINNFFEKLGAYETQMLIRRKLLYAISVEKYRLDKENNLQ